MQKLPRFMPTVVSTDEDVDKFDSEVRKFHVTEQVPFTADSRIDRYWANLRTEYPTLSKIALAALSCFTCPLVEGSFSVMKSVVTPTANRTNICTYSAIQTAKYFLASKGKGAVSYYKTYDVVYDPVDPALVSKMRGAASAYQKEQELGREEKKQKLDELKVRQTSRVTKRKAQFMALSIAKKARTIHSKEVEIKEMKKRNLHKLKELSKAKKGR